MDGLFFNGVCVLNGCGAEKNEKIAVDLFNIAVSAAIEAVVCVRDC